MSVIVWIGPGDPDESLWQDRRPEVRLVRLGDPQEALPDHTPQSVALAVLDARTESGFLQAFLDAVARWRCPALILSPSRLETDCQDLQALVRPVPDAEARNWVAMALRLDRSARRFQDLQDERRRQDSLVQKLVHDMKSPLTVMLMDLGMLERWWEKRRSDRFLGSVDRLTQCCEELTEMIQDLLDAHRARSHDLEIQFCNIGLGAVLREQLDAPPPLLAKKRAELRLDLRETETTVHIDPVLMGRVLRNLLKTAGVLCVVGGWIGLKVHRDRQLMRLRLETRGPEAEEEVVQSLLDPYAHEQWRTLGMDAGIGIGLNLSRLLIEAHSGCLSVAHQAPDVWAFDVQLPVARIQI